MPLVLSYTDTRETDNEILCEITTIGNTSGLQFTFPDRTQFYPYPLSTTYPSGILSFAVNKMGQLKMDTVSLVIPPEWCNDHLTDVLGHLFRETHWDSHPTHVITLVCEPPELFDLINKYFQGTWHL